MSVNSGETLLRTYTHCSALARKEKGQKSNYLCRKAVVLHLHVKFKFVKLLIEMQHGVLIIVFESHKHHAP